MKPKWVYHAHGLRIANHSIDSFIVTLMTDDKRVGLAFSPRKQFDDTKQIADALFIMRNTGPKYNEEYTVQQYIDAMKGNLPPPRLRE